MTNIIDIRHKNFFLHSLHVGNRRVIPMHQTLNPTDTKHAAVNTNMHIIMHMTQSMKAKKKLGSRPLRKNFKNLENCMTETTNMMTATKMVKLQYAWEAHWTRNWPSVCCHSPVENSKQRPLNWSWFIDMGTQITKDKTKAQRYPVPWMALIMFIWKCDDIFSCVFWTFTSCTSFIIFQGFKQIIIERKMPLANLLPGPLLFK